MNEEILGDRVNEMIAENQHLRVKVDNQASLITLLQEQYDKSAGSMNALRDKYDREMHDLRTERDQAVRKFKTIDALLLQASNIIMQALRARQGDEVPEKIPDRPQTVTGHHLLPVDPYAPKPNAPTLDSDIDEDVRQLVRRLPIRP
jgi:hypothetical protein